jgi:hypothetical protein
MDYSQICIEDRFQASCFETLRQFGVSLATGNDFEEFKQHLAIARPDHTIGDPFNPALNDFRKGNAEWLIGRDPQGKVMHTLALRLLPTENDSVAEYFRKSFRGFSPPDTDIDFDLSRYRPGPNARMIKGRVVYSGETWIGGASGSFRGSGLSGVLARFALLQALQSFEADYVVGFMIQSVAHKGFSMRAGFLHAEPLALKWYVRGLPEPLETFMVYMSAADIRFLLETPPAIQMAQAA